MDDQDFEKRMVAYLALATRVLALAAAVGLLVMFAFFAKRSYDTHGKEPIPGEMYIIAGTAATFLFGFGVKNRNGNGRK